MDSRTHCQWVCALDPGRGLVRGDDRRLAHLRADRVGRFSQFRLGADQHVGDRTFAEGDPEHFLHQPDQPLETDRLGDMEVQDQRHDAGAKGRTRRHPLGGRCAECAAAARAYPAMAVNPRHHRPDRRQLDVIIGMKARLVG